MNILNFLKCANFKLHNQKHELSCNLLYRTNHVSHIVNLFKLSGFYIDLYPYINVLVFSMIKG